MTHLHKFAQVWFKRHQIKASLSFNGLLTADQSDNNNKQQYPSFCFDNQWIFETSFAQALGFGILPWTLIDLNQVEWI